MRPIPEAHKQVIDSDKYYKKCVRHKEGTCRGRITIDHCLTFGSKQISELWNYVPTCAYHHAVDNFQSGGDLNRELQTYYALNRATDEELKKYSKAINYIDLKRRLNIKYGVPSDCKK